VREGHHYGKAGARKTQEVEPLVLARTSGTNVLDNPNTVVGIDDFLAYLKEHTRTLQALRTAYCLELVQEQKKNLKSDLGKSQQVISAYRASQPQRDRQIAPGCAASALAVPTRCRG